MPTPVELAARQPLDAFSRRLTGLAFALVCVSLFAYLPEMVELFTGGRVPTPGRTRGLQFLLFRLPRELLLLTLAAYLGYGLLFGRARRFLTIGLVRVVTVTTLWCLACVSYAVLVKDLPLTVPVLGLKALQYTPLLLAGYVLALRHSRAVLHRFADLLRWYVALIVALGIGQTLFGEHNTTLLGARSFGPFMNMNAYGSTLVMCALWFLAARVSHHKTHGVQRYGLWIAACVLTSLTTGSRTAMTLAILIVALTIFHRLDRRLKLVGITAVPLVVLSLPLLFASSGITGRNVSRSNASRLAMAEEVVDSFEKPADLVFGSGLGLYSKAVTVIFGQDRFPGQVGNPHSTYLDIVGSFGLPGLLAVLLGLGILMSRASRPEGAMFALVVALLAVPMNLCGLYPVDALVLLLGGVLLGIGVRQVRMGRSPAEVRQPRTPELREAGSG